MRASVSLGFPGKFVVVSETPLKGRGISEIKTSTSNFKYLATEKAYEKISRENEVEFVNVLH